MNIDTIAEDIASESCILVLGPDVAYNGKKPVMKELSLFLENKGVEHIFHEDEELFSSKTNFKRTVLRYIPEFFQNLPATDIHRKIAEIPFHLVISLSPDLILKQVFEEKEFDFKFDTYMAGVAPQEQEQPSANKPLLYNLLGDYMHRSSMILCFNHLFDYLSSVLGKFELHSSLRTQLNEANSILFYGFKFDKWYFKLIMRLLNSDDEVERLASIQDTKNREALVNYYKDEFGFYFENDHNEEEIIEELYKYFAEREALRRPGMEAGENNMITNIINVQGNENTIVQGNKGETNIVKNG